MAVDHRHRVLAGIAVVAAAGAVIAAGAALDPVAERRLEETDLVGTAPGQVVAILVALIVLAPLGEERLFRGLMLRALVRRLSFPSSTAIGAALFTLPTPTPTSSGRAPSQSSSPRSRSPGSIGDADTRRRSSPTPS